MSIGVYCGSFNPFHQGHWDIAAQAEFIFDEVIIARGINDSKKEVLEPLPKIIHHVYTVKTYEGLLTEFLKELEEEYPEESIVLIRGLRNGKDLEDEINLREWLKLYDDYNVVYLISHKDVRHISSSGIRNLKDKYPDLVKEYLV